MSSSRNSATLARNPKGTGLFIGEHGIKVGTAVYVLVVAMEEDATTPKAANAAPAISLAEIKKNVNGVTRRMTLWDLMQGNTPEFDPGELQLELKKKLSARPLMPRCPALGFCRRFCQR